MFAVALAALLSLLTSAVLTGLVWRYARALGLMDLPTARSAHARPTPRGGGLGVVVVVLGSVLVLWHAGRLASPAAAALGAGLLVAAIGLLDDRRHASVRARLSIHLLAAIWAVYWLSPLPPLILSPTWLWPGNWTLAVVLVLGTVWLINLYNFMDGIDGIAGVQALTTAGVAAALFWWVDHPELSLLAVFLAAAAGGFLVWNRPPARIFMGDVGSGFLGYIFAALMLVSFAGHALSIWTWLVLLGVFMVDTTYTLLRRLSRGERAYKAHASHAYQNAARRLGSHGKVTMAIAAINLVWLAPLAVCTVLWPDYGVAWTAIAWIPLLGLAILLGAGSRNIDK